MICLSTHHCSLHDDCVNFGYQIVDVSCLKMMFDSSFEPEPHHMNHCWMAVEVINKEYSAFTIYELRTLKWYVIADYKVIDT